MGENSKIEWTDHTFNPWLGCTPVSPACDGCYAEGWAKRAGKPELWQGERQHTSATNWAQPVKWNREAEESGIRRRVFCASLADVFDNQVPEEWRRDLWALIQRTPWLDWLLLTKRPQNIAKMLPWSWQQFGGVQPNIWLGTTVENQAEADRRIPHLLAVPAVVRFLSCEPLLGPVDLSGWLWGRNEPCADCPRDADCECGYRTRAALGLPSIGWVIAGGESGPGARPMHPDWARSLRDQCAAAGTVFLFKQWGEFSPSADHDPQEHRCRSTPETVHISGDREMRPTEQLKLIADKAPGWAGMCRIGKKAAGRLLDGIEHNGVPGGASC